MSAVGEPQEIWFVYDGDCPVCSHAAAVWRIRRDYGELQLLDAREHPDHPLLREIQNRRIDLDDGMVIHHDNAFYHGRDALQFMARYADRRGALNRVFRILFRSAGLSAVSYPTMRAGRNALLRLRGKTKIDNLTDRREPVFRPVFDGNWERLPDVLKARYNVRPYSLDRVVVKGTMDLKCRGPVRMLAPFYRLLNTVPAISERGVAVTVEFYSGPGSRAMRFNRHFNFNNRRPYRFSSRMLPRKDNEVIEIMGFNVCWRGLSSANEQGVTIRHKGYAIRLFSRLIPFPGTLLFGRCEGRETAVDASRFKLELEVAHPVFGKVYSYNGEFVVAGDE
jgi:predicted DCC family thiol-disulfide oxidoreductase YuxK